MAQTHKATIALALFIAMAIAPGKAKSQDSWRDIKFHESTGVFPNPERGFYAPRISDRIGRLDGLRSRGITLVLVEADLKGFKDRDISAEKLAEVQKAFAEVRRSGLKAIVRFAYGFTGRDYRTDPKDMDRIVGHIRQLKDLFQPNRDVLFAVQAGFLGPWGEWHGSNWGDPPSLEARRSVLFGLLDAVPDPITVHIRRPMFIRDIFAGESGGSDLTEASAYNGSRLSRTGWHDDALLSLPTDMGTFAERGWNRERELQWCAKHSRFTPFGGESVPPSARTPIDQVIRELELLHATYINSAYHQGTLEAWRKAEYKGATGFQHVDRRLGYRLVADRLRVAKMVDAAGSLRFELNLHNAGFASPHMPREVAVVLSQGESVNRVVLKDFDPRRWAPEAGTVTLRGAVPIAGKARDGKWRLSLQLADPSPSLQADGRYAIRLATEEVTFDEAKGLNVLADDIEIVAAQK